ncbi:hypothetical protein D0A36_22410 [Xanthomonas campestris]|nr:hypothetical protein D0A36_22410 [Xanthomonas campestris]RFF52895.1 hypothetical protein D0A41_22430 [Xanthomonas campestris]
MIDGVVGSHLAQQLLKQTKPAACQSPNRWTRVCASPFLKKCLRFLRDQRPYLGFPASQAKAASLQAKVLQRRLPEHVGFLVLVSRVRLA